VFKGRARRAEFWWYTLFDVIFGSILTILDRVFALYITDDRGILNTIWTLVTFMPSLAVTVRRMHDCDKSGWFMIIPIYGNIILPCTNGISGPNRYGPDPKKEHTGHYDALDSSGL
jgi:uncharacterized membrane protein YhaH (DUF805 family)